MEQLHVLQLSSDSGLPTRLGDGFSPLLRNRGLEGSIDWFGTVFTEAEE